MTLRTDLFVSVAHLGTSGDVVLWTVPPGFRALVHSCSVLNRGATDAVFSLWTGPDEDDGLLWCDRVLVPKGRTWLGRDDVWPQGHDLTVRAVVGDMLTVRASGSLLAL